VWVLVFYVVAFLALSAVVLVRRDIGAAGGGRRPWRRSALAAPARPRPAAARTGLRAAVQAELLVTVRRPTVWALAAALPVYALLSGYGLPYLFYATAGSGTLSGLSPSLILPTLLPDHFVATVMGTLGLNQGLGFDATAPFLIIGGLLAGGEWERGTIRTALLQGPGRLTTLAGQVVTLGAVLVAGLGATYLLCAGASGLIAVAESGSPFASSDAGLFPEGPVAAGAFGSAVLIGAAYGAIGLALGTAFRNASGPIAVALLWAVIVQPQLATLAGQAGGVLRTINDALPSGDVLALVQFFAPLGSLTGNPSGPPGDPVTAAWSLTCYVAVALAVPALLIRRRDIA
jgi:ABC-2 type transport system permease protein